MKIKLGIYLAAKNLPESKQEDAAYELNKLDMLEVTLFSTYTLAARALRTVILNSTLALIAPFTLQRCGFHPEGGQGLHL